MVREHLLEILRPYGQEHLLAFWEQLDPPQRESLARQIEAIDFPLLRRLYEARGRQADMADLAARAEPPPAFRLDPAGNPFTPQQARQRGIEALRAGELGVILVAGGQGTRLGFDRPKGMFPIGPISAKSLFQIHVEKIVAAGRRYGVRIPLYLMTSPATHEDTAAFFAEHGRFGLPEEDLFLFCQGTMPAVDARDRPGAVGRAGTTRPQSRRPRRPVGRARPAAAHLDEIERRRIRHLFYLQVDNPLVDICGREFVGLSPLGRLGVLHAGDRQARPAGAGGERGAGGRPAVVIEYSDLPRRGRPAAEPRRLAGDLGRQHRGPRDRRRVSAAAGRGRCPARQ